MKKIILSSVVIIAFIAYSLYQRAFGMQTLSVVTPKKNPTPSAMPEQSATPIPTLPFASPTSNTISPRTSTKPSATPTQTPSPTVKPNSPYKDGSFTGDPADAFYGNIQVQATIANGKITNIQFLQAPNDRSRSIEINSQADPMLAQEAIQSQTANVDIVSGATDSSQAFIQSMQSALDKAKN